MNRERIREFEQMAAGEYPNLAGIVVSKNGDILYQRYFNGFTCDDALHVFSITKSVVSALMGIAMEQGHIKSIDQPVLDFFPDYRPPAEEASIQGVTLRHMLTMTAPYKYEAEPFDEFFASENWISAALGYLGGRPSPGDFLYSALVGTHILSGVLVNATGQSLLDFAGENLFAPLGIELAGSVVFGSAEEQLAWSAREKHPRSWVADPQGFNTASWGMTLTPLDLNKIGQLYLDGGVWKGRQIVPSAWVAESTRPHSLWKEMGLPYGYLWWIVGDSDSAYAAIGDGGNVIYISPEKQLVVSIASVFMPEAKDRIQLIRNWIEPIFAAQA